MAERGGRFDRLWRLGALLLLCGLVYYFSFDSGRQVAATRQARHEDEKARLQAEIDSLRTQLSLQSKEIASLKSQLAGSGQPQAPRPAGAGAEAAPPPEGGEGESASSLAMGGAGSGGDWVEPDIALPDPAQGPAAQTEGAAEGAAPAAAAREPDLSIPEPPPDASGAPPRELARIALRPGEPKLILGGQVRLSVLEIDSLDKVAQVRVQHLDSDARQTRTMEAGDSMTIMRGGARVVLLLDQLTAFQAVFLLVGP
jgi:hypothetical protein